MIRERTADPGDDQLMTLYAEGDFSAFRRLFEHLAPWLRAFFRRSFSDGATAEDLTQATFLRLHGARTSYQIGRPLKPWLFSIALGVRRDEVRRRQRQPRHVDDAVLDVTDTDAQSEVLTASAVLAPVNDHCEAVREAIRRLPDSQRVVIHMHQYEGLTFEQIAERLKTTPGAVRVRASRAYERLREELRPLLPDRLGTK